MTDIKLPSLMPERNFNALSLRDLLEAREATHVHIARKDNVIGTAIGRYLIRLEDPNSQDPFATYQGNKDDLGPRRLDNSIITPWSWPCLIVFVRKWRPLDEFRKDPQNFISPFVDLPDGRTVPVCVVEASPDTGQVETAPQSDDDANFLCGGLPVFSEVQDVDRFGTLGCLATDGKGVYALTAAHVAGFPGTPARASIQGESFEIGEASLLQVNTLPFEQVYPTLPGQFVDSCLDVGLIKLKSVRHWSGSVHGIGEVGELFSLDKDTLSLSIIGTPVRAYGSASGPIEGEVKALFYRYQSLGGYDYVADLMIGPQKNAKPFMTLPGDSGTIFFWDHVRAAINLEIAKEQGRQRSKKGGAGLNGKTTSKIESEVRAEFEKARQEGRHISWRPLAVQWGGQRFFGAPAAVSGESFPFVLATSLGTACRALGVELIRGFDIALPQYWGEVGHFTIGETACTLLSVNSPKLKTLFKNNQFNIGFSDSRIQQGTVTGLGPAGFIPLADVPDDVWKIGGAGVKRVKDNPTHYADMDEPGGVGGQTLFQLCANPANIRTSIWQQHYQGTGTDIKYQGSLPFRVWQIFDAMVDFVKQGDVKSYICAAGILAHYVGDACQPLHGSRRADEDGVHSPYETKMLNAVRNNTTSLGLIAQVKAGIAGRTAGVSVKNGKEAAIELIKMMENVSQILPPQTIINEWLKVKNTNPINYKAMWKALGGQTGKCMAEGALLLASLWQSAWVQGKGDQKITDVSEVNYNQDLRPLFEPNGTPGHGQQFLESFYLNEYPNNMK